MPINPSILKAFKSHIGRLRNWRSNVRVPTNIPGMQARYQAANQKAVNAVMGSRPHLEPAAIAKQQSIYARENKWASRRAMREGSERVTAVTEANSGFKPGAIRSRANAAQIVAEPKMQASRIAAEQNRAAAQQHQMNTAIQRKMGPSSQLSLPAPGQSAMSGAPAQPVYTRTQSSRFPIVIDKKPDMRNRMQRLVQDYDLPPFLAKGMS